MCILFNKKNKLIKNVGFEKITAKFKYFDMLI